MSASVVSADQLNSFLEKLDILCEKLKVEDCPVCDLKLAEDKIVCENGHGICTSCKLVVNVCPVCTASYPGEEGAEGGSIGVLPPPKRPRQSTDADNAKENDDPINGKRCANSIRGCQVKLSEEDDLSSHEMYCTFRLYTCKICSVPICLRKLQGHCERSHPDRFVKNETSTIVIRNDTQNGDMIYYFMQAHSEIFWFWRNNVDSFVVFGLQYCGDPSRTKEFMYSLEVVAMNQKSIFKFRGPVLFDTSEIPQYTPSDEFVRIGKNLIGADSKFKVSVRKETQ